MIVLLLLNIILAFIIALFDVNYLYSFEISFICSLLIFFVSFQTMQKRVNYSISLLDNDLNDYDNHISKKEKFFIGARISFGIFRIISYIILCFCVVALINNQLFFIIPFIVGTLASSIGLAILLLRR